MRRVLRNCLQPVGYSVQEAGSGEAALAALEQNRSGLIILDINMPGIGGIETCRRIRHLAPSAGIVMMSVRDREDDKVVALEAGADDYVTKPFRLRELLARLRAVHRRTCDDDAHLAVLKAGDLKLDLTNRMLWKCGVEVHLTQKEFDILALLMSRPDTPIPHARILKAVWGPEYGGESEYLRTYMRLLRKKIENDAARPEYIVTEPWVGYRFRDPLSTSHNETPAVAPVA
ncbi:MAG TPA: response regulator transcription factor, partial [Bryobacteraceae bacterium]|nr:response regulator transcription factor [Bryobacteraceae bacterium]